MHYRFQFHLNSDLKEEDNFVEMESMGPAWMLGNDRQPGQGQQHLTALPAVLPGPMGAVLQREPAGHPRGRGMEQLDSLWSMCSCPLPRGQHCTHKGRELELQLELQPELQHLLLATTACCWN